MKAFIIAMICLNSLAMTLHLGELITKDFPYTPPKRTVGHIAACAIIEFFIVFWAFIVL